MIQKSFYETKPCYDRCITALNRCGIESKSSSAFEWAENWGKILEYREHERKKPLKIIDAYWTLNTITNDSGYKHHLFHIVMVLLFLVPPLLHAQTHTLTTTKRLHAFSQPLQFTLLMCFHSGFRFIADWQRRICCHYCCRLYGLVPSCAYAFILWYTKPYISCSILSGSISSCAHTHFDFCRSRS